MKMYNKFSYGILVSVVFLVFVVITLAGFVILYGLFGFYPISPEENRIAGICGLVGGFLGVKKSKWLNRVAMKCGLNNSSDVIHPKVMTGIGAVVMLAFIALLY
jgi:hypothetical protein